MFNAFWNLSPITLACWLVLQVPAMAAGVETVAAPKQWSGDEGNPLHESAGGWCWRLDQVFPAEPLNPDAYRPMDWDPTHADWRPTDHAQEDMPSVRVVDGEYRWVVGGPLETVRHLKAAALTFTAPKEGRYGIDGQISGQVTGRGPGLPPTTVLLIHRSGDRLELIDEWSLNDSESAELGGVAVEMKADDALHLYIAAYQDHTRMEVRLRGYAVGTSLAHRAQRRLAGPASEVISNPSAEALLAANQSVIERGEGGVVFPPSAGILNVHAFGAKGDGVHDDTDAIQAAYNKAGLIYFPNGTYLISDEIRAPSRRGSAPSRRIVQGQSRDGVVLRLMDGATGFDNPDEPRAVLVTSYGVAQAFRNSVRNLTIEIGAGNPGAVGLDFFSSNSGTASDLVIRSAAPEGSGRIGLLMHGDAGPQLVQRVEVEGFDIGVLAAGGQSLTLEDILVRDQREVGLRATDKATLHRFKSRNEVLALDLRGVFNNVITADLVGGNGGPAIAARGPNILLRDVNAKGYGVLLEHDGRIAVSGLELEEWTGREPITLGDAEGRTLRLPIVDAPKVPLAPLSEWVRVHDFEPASLPRQEEPNWAPALQAALNDGRSTVYLAARTRGFADGTVTVPGHVKRIIGLESELRAYDGRDRTSLELVTAGDREDGPLVIERIDAIYGRIRIHHQSPRPLVVRSVGIHDITLEPGAGDLFIEDSVTSFLTINGQNVWARQHNPEHFVNDSQAGYLRPHVLNNGGKYWCLGYKTEQLQPKVYTINKGVSEVYAYVLSNRLNYPQPMFLVSGGSRLSLALHENVGRKKPFLTTVRLNKRGGEIIDLDNEDAPRQGLGASFPLLVAE